MKHHFTADIITVERNIHDHRDEASLGGKRLTTALSAFELYELGVAFADLTNYESDDLMTPIDPLTYRSPDKDNCLHIAALRGHLRAVELLVKAGFDVNEPGDIGNTPLHYARNASVLAFLVAQGGRQDIRNGFGSLATGWWTLSDLDHD